MKQLRDEDKIITQVKHIHMIGIGGSGMCPLAEILHGKGYILTGSDNNESDPDYEGDFEISFTFYLKTLGGAASK